jgi:hypothetical protein
MNRSPASSTRQTAAVVRLALSRQRLQQVLLAQAAGGGPREQLAALVLRHPLGSAIAALLLGALVARLRPWRWTLKPAWWAALWPQALAALAAAPLGLWVDVVSTLWRQHGPAAGTPTDAPPAAAPEAAAPGPATAPRPGVGDAAPP